MARRCVGVRLRLINRAVSRIYDDHLRPFEVKISQVNILAVVGVLGPVSPTTVARKLSLEKSTLSRNLRGLEERGWVEVGASEGRGGVVQLTRAGDRLLSEIEPAWQQAQRDVRKLLGADAIDAIADVADPLLHADE